MKLTNKYNLPEPIVMALGFDSYDKGKSDFSTTELIGPPKASILRRRHWNELEEDVSTRVWAMSGQVKHLIIERVAKLMPDRFIAEQRFYREISGKLVGGQIDLYDKQDKTLYDMKETKVWKVTKGDMTEWVAQGNINRFLCGDEFEIEHIKNIAFLKDWTDRDTGQDGYPQTPVVCVPLEMWSTEKTEAYLTERVRLHHNYMQLPDDSIPPCSREERWEGAEKWKVKQKDAARAIKSYPDEENPDPKAAERNAQQKAFEQNSKPKSKGGYEVLHFPATPTRCLRFCSANTFCNFYQTQVKGKFTDSEE